MTKGNRTSSVRETVYDRCAYVGCYNGKFINGRRLFHFPSETDRRLEMWIERSGNFRLRTWAATSLRKAGLCGDHFDERCFTNATRKALRRNVVPRHYTEDLKLRKSNVESATVNNDNCKSNMNVRVLDKIADDPMNGDELQSVPGKPSTVVQIQLCSDDDESWHTNEFTFIDVNACDSAPSPVIEFIVEELDETLICNTEASESERHSSPVRESPVDDSTCEREENTKMKQGSSKKPTSSVALEKTTERRKPSESDSEVERTDSNVSMNGHSPGLKSDKSETSTNEEPSLPTAPKPQPKTIITTDNDENVKLTLLRLRNDKQRLLNTVRTLKQKLRRAEAREISFKNARSKLDNVDEFLDIQECTNPVARAMVKLALHKHHVPYTKAEKEFATKLYKHSSAVFARLRKAGCNFPDRSTMRRWIANDKGESSLGDFMETSIAADDDDDVDEAVAIENIDEIRENAIVEETQDRINEGSDRSVENAEVAMDELDEDSEEIRENGIVEETQDQMNEGLDGSIENAEVAMDELVEDSEEIRENGIVEETQDQMNEGLDGSIENAEVAMDELDEDSEEIRENGIVEETQDQMNEGLDGSVENAEVAMDELDEDSEEIRENGIVEETQDQMNEGVDRSVENVEVGMDEFVEDFAEVSENGIAEKTQDQMNEGLDELVENVEIVMDELIGHYEEVIEDAVEYDEYEEQLPPDDEIQDDFR